MCFPALAQAPAGSAPLRESRRVVASSDSAWTVHWRARTSERGGQFRLYRGAGPDALQIVDIQQAAAGLNSYRFDDAPDGLARRYYQLRYVGSKGEELILASLRVETAGLQSTPGSLELPPPVAKALPAARPLLAVVRARQAPPSSTAPDEGDRPEPDVPPPRVAA